MPQDGSTSSCAILDFPGHASSRGISPLLFHPCPSNLWEQSSSTLGDWKTGPSSLHGGRRGINPLGGARLPSLEEPMSAATSSEAGLLSSLAPWLIMLDT